MSAAEVDTAETGGELTISKEPEDQAIKLTYYYLRTPVYPFLRMGVEGGSGEYRYKWYYAGTGVAQSVGTRFATTTCPEQMVTSDGWYYCVVQDTETYKEVRSRDILVSQDLSLNNEVRINGSKLEWKESVNEYVASRYESDYLFSRYTFSATRYDKTHNKNTDLCLKIERSRYTQEIFIRKVVDGVQLPYDYTSYYEVTYDGESRIYSLNLKDIISSDYNYDDIEYAFGVRNRIYDNRKSYVEDGTGGERDTEFYPASKLYRGDVYSNTSRDDEHYGEVQIMDGEYSVGSTLKANLNGGRWSGKESNVDIVWQRYTDDTWNDIGTGSTYTVTEADRGRSIRFYAKPNFKGWLNNDPYQALYWPEEKFISNTIIIPIGATIQCNITEPKAGVIASPDFTWSDDFPDDVFEVATNTVSGTGLDWYCENDSRFVENKVFEGGKTYEAIVYFRVKSGYGVNPNDITVKFNGKIGKVTKASSGALKSTCSFYVEPGYTITFDSNGGSGEMEPVYVEKGSTYTLPACTFTPPSGKVFDKWAVNGVVSFGTITTITVNEDTVLSAQWKDASSGTYSISGSVTSYLSDTDVTSIILSKKAGESYAFQGVRTVSGNSGSYGFTGLSNGQYRLTVSKKNHVTRTYNVTILLGSKTQDVTINPKGDVDGNGKVQAADAMKAYQHAQGKADAQLTDYAFLCADVAPVGEPNGKVQAADAMVIYQQAQGKHSLF